MAGGQRPDPRGSRYARLGTRQEVSAKATWEDANADDLWRTVYQVTNSGDAIMFSRTRDGGAVVLTVLSGDDRQKAYATGEEEVASLLADVRAACEADS